ncbi:sugar transferase [Enterococcus diestrammenae]|uniref:sugar transferase n=1 Tax=Enterococcus diestrammenae TaxID=1155073 RepID=UPI00195D89F9
MKNKYVVEIRQETNLHAGTKAKQDITSILCESGFHKLGIEIPTHKLARLLKGNYLWKKELAKTQKGDYVFYQYPAYSRVLSDSFVKNANQKKLTKVLIIHDIDSLRFYIDRPLDYKREITFFNQFDYIIAHNERMKKWLIENGVKQKIITLKLFDYLSSFRHDILLEAKENNSIVFAGNLSKSSFLSELKSSTPIHLYGVEPAKNYHPNLSYQGAFSSAELEEKLIGHKYGLVWDGDSVLTCAGISGNYMRFNNPHKVSLYLSLGIPVIIWRQAALANFILDEGVGIVIDDLRLIDEQINKISKNEYKTMRINALKISKKITGGEFILAAVTKIFEN